MVDSRRALRSAYWSGLESASLAVLSFLSLIFYTHLLTPEQMGIFAVLLALVEILSVIITMPFHDALVQKETASDLDFDTAFTATMVLSVAMAIGAMASAPWVAQAFGHAEARSAFMWMVLVFPLSGLSATIIARQRRELAFRALAIRSLTGRIIGAVVGISMASMGYGLWSLVAQQVVMAGVASGTLWVLSHNRPRFRFDPQRFRSLIAFGLSSLGALLFSYATKRVFIILVGLYLGARSTGYLNVAFRVFDMLWTLLGSAVTQVALPILSRLQGNDVRLRRAYFRAVGLSCTLLYPCFLGLAAIAPEGIKLMFGAKWQPAADYLSVLACLAVLQVPRMFVGPMLVARGRPRDVLPGMFAQASFLIIAVVAFGIPSAAWAVRLWVGCELVLTPVAGFMLWRQTGLTIRDQTRGIWAPLGAVAAMLAALLLTRQALPAELSLISRLSILIAMGGTAYLAATILIDRKRIADMRTLFMGAMQRVST